jgi:Domain of unknown function (DUF3883)
MKVSENELRLLEDERTLKNQISLIEKPMPNYDYYIEKLAPWVYAIFILVLIISGYYINENNENFNKESYWILVVIFLHMVPVIYECFGGEWLVLFFLGNVIKLGMPNKINDIEKEKLKTLNSELYQIKQKLFNIYTSRIKYGEYLELRERQKEPHILKGLNILLKNIENNLYTFKDGFCPAFESDTYHINTWLRMQKLSAKLENFKLVSSINHTQVKEIVQNENKVKTSQSTLSGSSSGGSKKSSNSFNDSTGKILPLNKEKQDIHPPQKFDTVQHVKNIEIGELGELFVIENEKKRLKSAGRSDLAQMITHISKENGDSAGFDVLSYDINGHEKLIEVKTTSGFVSDDFFLTENEYRCMNNNVNYYIYRVFNYSIENNIGKIKEIHCLSDKNQLNINISSYFVKPNILKSN